MNDYSYLKILAQLSDNVYKAEDSLPRPTGYIINGDVKKLTSPSGFQAVLY